MLWKRDVKKQIHAFMELKLWEVEKNKTNNVYEEKASNTGTSNFLSSPKASLISYKKRARVSFMDGCEEVESKTVRRKNNNQMQMMSHLNGKEREEEPKSPPMKVKEGHEKAAEPVLFKDKDHCIQSIIAQVKEEKREPIYFGPKLQYMNCFTYYTSLLKKSYT